MTEDENKCLTEYKKLFCTNCEADCTTSILDCNGYQFFSKGYEQGQKDKEYLDNTNLITKPSMNVFCAIAESQLGNYCIADRNKNYRAGLNDEPKENIELNRDKTELVNSVTELKSKVTELEKQIDQLSNDNHVLKTAFITQKEQIEKMKCCGNCDNNAYCDKEHYGNDKGCDKWEYAE